MSTAAVTPLNPLVEKIRAAHPGAYDDMDDATLTKKILAKYPQYSDLAAPKIETKPVDMQYTGLLTGNPSLSQDQNTQSDFPGFEGSYASGDEDKGLAMTGAGVATGAALASPAAIAALRAAAVAHPFAAEVVKAGLKGIGWGAGLHAGAKFAKLGDLLGASSK